MQCDRLGQGWSGCLTENARILTCKTPVACRLVRVVGESRALGGKNFLMLKTWEHRLLSIFLLLTMTTLTTLTKIEFLPLPAVRVQRLNPDHPDRRGVAKLRRLRLGAAAIVLVHSRFLPLPPPDRKPLVRKEGYEPSGFSVAAPDGERLFRCHINQWR